MAKQWWMSTGNVISVLTLALVVVTLVLWLTGQFGEIANSGDSGNTANAPAGNNNAGNNDAPAPTPEPAPTPQPSNDTDTVWLDTLETQLEASYFKWDEDAPVSIIEFSDVECPFCQRHHSAGTLDSVISKFGEDQVSVYYMHFPLSFHTSAQKAGEALECAGELQGNEGFWNYKKAIFDKGGKPTLDVVEATATEQGFDTDAFMECVNSGQFAQKVSNQMAFGRSLGVTGTPGNVVVNNETGEYITVSGAVPATSFDAPVNQFLGN